MITLLQKEDDVSKNDNFDDENPNDEISVQEINDLENEDNNDEVSQG